MLPLERAAKAIWIVSGQPKRPPNGQPDWQRFVPQARAVLEALAAPCRSQEPGIRACAYPLAEDIEQIWIDRIEGLSGASRQEVAILSSQKRARML